MLRHIEKKKIMEEAQKKLRALIVKAQNEKIDLKNLKAIKNQEIFFGVSKKFKLFGVLFTLASLHGLINHLVFTDKVIYVKKSSKIDSNHFSV